MIGLLFMYIGLSFLLAFGTFTIISILFSAFIISKQSSFNILQLTFSLFFGLGGVLCVYIVAPFLERNLQRLTNKLKISMCIALLLIFGADNVYSHFHPHVGEGISSSVENPTKVPNLIQRF